MCTLFAARVFKQENHLSRWSILPIYLHLSTFIYLSFCRSFVFTFQYFSQFGVKSSHLFNIQFLSCLKPMTHVSNVKCKKQPQMPTNVMNYKQCFLLHAVFIEGHHVNVSSVNPVYARCRITGLQRLLIFCPLLSL